MDGPTKSAIDVCKDNKLNNHDASFVDVIHTNGGFKPCAVCFGNRARLGDLHAIGDMDFYAGNTEWEDLGGEWQKGCDGGAACSHQRAEFYYFNTINNGKILE